jgi:hypothetical protein
MTLILGEALGAGHLPGLDPGIHLLRKEAIAKAMVTRVCPRSAF